MFVSKGLGCTQCGRTGTTEFLIGSPGTVYRAAILAPDIPAFIKGPGGTVIDAGSLIIHVNGCEHRSQPDESRLRPQGTA